MAAKKYFFAFVAVGGLVLALALGGPLYLVTGHPNDWAGWSVLLIGSPLALLLAGCAFWYLWVRERAQERSRLFTRLAEGDLTQGGHSGMQDQREVRRLLFSLRRALSQVQRVTSNVRRTCQGVSEEVRVLLEAARRQGGAVERSQGSVSSMGQSLQSAGKRVTQLETFAQ
ncbi:MAG: ABC transporter substrate-binding protein, partial [Archangium sp.]